MRIPFVSSRPGHRAWTLLACGLWAMGSGVACRPGGGEAPSASPDAASPDPVAQAPAGAEVRAAQEPGEPVLWIDDPVHDWGITYRGQQLEHSFTVANRGTGSLVIEELKSHCGCTVTRADEVRKRLGPGETTRIAILIDTALLRGAVKKDTDIISNAPGENKLWMQGVVEDLWKVEPTLPKVEVVRGSSLRGGPTRVALTPNLDKAFEVEKVSARNGFLVPALTEVERGQRYEIALAAKVEDEEEADAFRTEVLEVATRVDGRVLSLHLQVPVVLKDRIEVTPSKSVYVHRKETAALRDGGAAVEKTLHVQSIGGPEHTFRIEDAAAKEGAFALRVETVQPGKHYRLLVTLAELPEEGQRFLKDSIEVRTDDPLVPTLVIPAMAQF